MKKWLAKILGVQSVQMRPINPVNLRLDDWRKNSMLVSEASKIYNAQIFRALLETLKNESPGNYALPPIGVHATDRVSHLGEIIGYNKCLNNIEAMTTLLIEDKPLEASFAPAEPPPNILDPKPEE